MRIVRLVIWLMLHLIRLLYVWILLPTEFLVSYYVNVLHFFGCFH